MIYRILESIHYNIIMVEQPLIINTLVELGSTIEPTPTDKVILPMLKANGRARLSSMLCWWLPYAMILAISGEPTNSWWRSSTLAGCRLARFSWNPARDYWHIYSPGCIIYIYMVMISRDYLWNISCQFFLAHYEITIYIQCWHILGSMEIYGGTLLLHPHFKERPTGVECNQIQFVSIYTGACQNSNEFRRW